MQNAVLAAVAALVVAASPAFAGDADVIGVQARRRGDVVDFDVTVRSKDTGWDRYADRLEAVGPDGQVLATRVLDHPHDDEQPFTRSITDVHLDPALRQVVIRAHFKPAGAQGDTKTVALPLK